MGRVRQIIKTGNYQVVIVNQEIQGRLMVTINDKKAKTLGQLVIEREHLGVFEEGKIDLPISLN
jgi:hypothetical protein